MGAAVLPDPGEIPQETRRRMLLEARRLGVKPRDLGVSYSFLYKMARGVKPVPDHIAARLLELLDDSALLRADPSFFSRYVDASRIDGLSVEKLVTMLVEWAKKHPAEAKVLLDTLEGEIERLGLAGKTIRITGEHLEEWRLYLEARVREGRLGRKTASDRDRYLRRALEDLDYLLGPARLQAYIRRLTLEAPDRAAHTAKALRLFARHVLRDRELYEAIPSVQPRRRKREAPTWEEICAVIDALEWPPAKAYMLLLASTGARSGYVRALRLGQVDLGRRLILFEVEGATKRQYIAFITEPVKTYLEQAYLPWRELYLERHGIKSDRLLPVRRDRLHAALYQAMDRVLGRRFQPYTVRHRVLTHLARHLPSLEAKLLSGHASREVYLEYYYQLDRLEDLRSKYDKAMKEVPCLQR